MSEIIIHPSHIMQLVDVMHKAHNKCSSCGACDCVAVELLAESCPNSSERV